jgi:hypothetical protein
MRAHFGGRVILPGAVIETAGIGHAIGRDLHDQGPRVIAGRLEFRRWPETSQAFARNRRGRGKGAGNGKGDMALFCIRIIPDPALTRAKPAVDLIGIIAHMVIGRDGPGRPAKDRPAIAKADLLGQRRRGQGQTKRKQTNPTHAISSAWLRGDHTSFLRSAIAPWHCPLAADLRAGIACGA